MRERKRRERGERECVCVRAFACERVGANEIVGVCECECASVSVRV